MIGVTALDTGESPRQDWMALSGQVEVTTLSHVEHRDRHLLTCDVTEGAGEGRHLRQCPSPLLAPGHACEW